ncbi:dynactin subunit [Cladophialophora carrionii]|uniref:Dynactin subunit n=1 Tax=Cladophialophora carrionii TaxID=86049 RepID=A0A1C1CLE4_9EURO|nr:dynactin subunit [Cladophialophora carrionii]
MAVSKKYAGLPDLDAAPEVYETPDLADDVSTVPTGTVRTGSPSPSSGDEVRPGLDRQPLDRDGARRRFEPSLVDAKDVDFSDSIAGTRRAYRTRSSRRRRRRRRLEHGGGEEVGDLSDSEEETLPIKLARLKREAEEVRLELERREMEKDEDAEFQDSVEQQQQQQQQGSRKQGEEDVDADGVHELSRVLDGLSTKARLKTADTVEDQFLSTMASTARQRQHHLHHQTQASHSDPATAAPQSAPTTLAAVADFSDRLTGLESALGISSMSSDSQTSAILPTLASLAAQITALSATLAPPSTTSAGPEFQSQSRPNVAYLDTISSKLKTLIAESDRLSQSRKAALASLADLHEKRMQQLVSGASVHGNSRSARMRGLSTASSTGHTQGNNEAKVDGTTGGGGGGGGGPGAESLQIQSQLFLDEQASKITALYHLLPSIQELQPLLPVVLERLRTLNVLHNGAAQAKGLIDDLESRQREMKDEVAKWREAVEHVEKGITEAEDVMKSNVDVLGGRVRDVEERVGRLGQAR